VAEGSHEHRDIRSLKDLNERLLQEIEHFFISYIEMAGKQFKPLARRGPHRAEKLVKQAARDFRCEHERRVGQASGNGKQESPGG
jgi:inorganic pyrophosphatase